VGISCEVILRRFATLFPFVMPALVAGIHVLLPFCGIKDVDGRVKPGHDGKCGPQW
jgi:hypothetical protein